MHHFTMLSSEAENEDLATSFRSRTSSANSEGLFEMEGEAECLFEENLLEARLGHFLDWFRSNGVEAGNPEDIREEYLHKNKARVSQLFSQGAKSVTNTKEGRRLARPPAINTKLD